MASFTSECFSDVVDKEIFIKILLTPSRPDGKRNRKNAKTRALFVLGYSIDVIMLMS